MKQVKGVEDVKELRARNYGSNAVVDVVLSIKGDLEFQEAHNIAYIMNPQIPEYLRVPSFNDSWHSEFLFIL